MNPFAALRVIWKAARGDEHAKFTLAEAISRRIYPAYKFSEFGRNWLQDREFLDYYVSLVDDRNFHSLDRKYLLHELLKLTAAVDGDTAECGVYRGASSWLICRFLGKSGKRHHLFDSFSGLSAPTAEDGSYWKSGDLRSSEEEVRTRLKEFDNWTMHRGWIPEKFPEVGGARFSFVHIDVDLYDPTKASLEFFYERTSPGGILLCDDYGFSTCPGATRAVDEFFKGKPEPLLHLPTGQGLVFKR